MGAILHNGQEFMEALGQKKSPELAKGQLTIDQKLDVSYCIPNWLRDEQIKRNCELVKDRIEGWPADQELREEPIACINFGPSLAETWEQIRNFQYILTCSGAHKFLVDRGIVPTWHLDVDPRPHKIQLIGTPQKGTEYLIASTCNPKLVEFLLAAGATVKIWHIFDSTEEGIRLLPPGDFALTGGCSAGIRTLTMARFLGFKHLHVFGMDGCEGPTGKHAAEHPNQPKGAYEVQYEGATYRTTPAILEAARQTWYELDQMPEVKTTFYGDGLVQHMAKHYVPKNLPKHALGGVAYSKLTPISAAYLELNQKMHQQNLAYGVGGGKYADTVKKLYKILQKTTEFVSVLDYGCGKGYLGKSLPFPIAEYDPAIPGKTESPKPADLVICTDVLEHVEPDHLLIVLHDLKRVVRQIGFFTIHTGPAQKTLPDGRNTHLIQNDIAWWKHKLEKRFKISKLQQIGPELLCIVKPKAK